MCSFILNQQNGPSSRIAGQFILVPGTFQGILNWRFKF